MAERGITGQVVPQLGGAPPPPNCCEVKSLVFLVDGQPIVSACSISIAAAQPALQCSAPPS